LAVRAGVDVRADVEVAAEEQPRVRTWERVVCDTGFVDPRGEEWMGDLVEETLRGVRARLGELAPIVAEYERLEAAYEALDGSGGRGAGEGRLSGASTTGRRSGRARRERGRPASRGSGPRAMRGENKRAVYGVIAERPGVTVAEIAAMTGIAKPLIYNTTRAGVERGELEKVALPGRQSGFRPAQGAASGLPDTSAG
jgi:hypothetical protein